jgi:hypothetical protein
VVVAVAVLLTGVLSLGDETVAVLLIVPGVDGAVTWMLMVGAVVLAAIDARVHVTVVEPEHDQPVPAAETRVEPAGSGSETLTFVAGTVAELLVTLIA